MRAFQFISLLLMLLPAAQAQSDLQKQVDELSLKLACLENENNSLKSSIRLQDSLEYMAVRYEIFETFSNVPKLDFDFKSTTDKIAVTGLFTKLMQANNPSSDILGFQFTDVIFAAADKYFKDLLKNEPDKKRFGQVVSKIVSNPVVSGLAQMNPVTSVVSALISTIAGFTTSSVNIEKEGNRIKNIAVEHEDVFNQQNISAFRNELQVYIDFYDALILSSDKYLTGLDNLNTKYSYLIESVRDYKKEIYTGMDMKETNLLIQLATLLPDPETGPVNFNLYLNDQKLIKSLRLARQFPVLQQSVSAFKKEYNTLLFQFLSEYIQTLSSAREFPKSALDKTKAQKLISEIQAFIESLKNDKNEEPDAFCEN